MLYRATGNIRMDHKHYQAGDEIELTGERAAQLAHTIEGPITKEAPAVFEPLPEIVEDPVVMERVSKPTYRYQKKNRE